MMRTQRPYRVHFQMVVLITDACSIFDAEYQVTRLLAAPDNRELIVQEEKKITTIKLPEVQVKMK